MKTNSSLKQHFPYFFVDVLLTLSVYWMYTIMAHESSSTTVLNNFLELTILLILIIVLTTIAWILTLYSLAENWEKPNLYHCNKILAD